jgi:hypothetical protein
MEERADVWTEADTRDFLDFGATAVSAREEQTAALLALIPDRVFEQLRWLEEAGFRAMDCFWMRAGHAVYGGYV